MDLNEIKDIIEADGGKFIIVENGKPTLVVTSFEQYKTRLKNNSAGSSPASFADNRPAQYLTIDDLPV